MGRWKGTAADAMLEALLTADVEAQAPLREWLEALAFVWAMSGEVASIRIVGRGLPLGADGRRAALAEVERVLCGIADASRGANVVLSVATVAAGVRIVVHCRLPTGTAPGARTVRDVIDLPVGVASGAFPDRTGGSAAARGSASGAAARASGAAGLPPGACGGSVSVRFAASAGAFGMRS